MILLWFILGIALAFGIARYNESNKLFWQLMLAFILGYAVTVMCTRTFNGNERSNESFVQVCPTQAPIIAASTNAYLFSIANSMAQVKVTDLELVSQDFTPVQNEADVISSEVFERTRDQPNVKLIQPPECLVKVILTHRDTG